MTWLRYSWERCKAFVRWLMGDEEGAVTPPPTFAAIHAPIVDRSGLPSWAFLKKLQEWEAKLYQTIDLVGQIAANAKIQGRTEGIGTTVGKLDSTGVVLASGADFTRAYLNKNTDNIADGTGSPLSGGKRGFVALDTNNRLANTRRATMALASYTPTTQPVTQSGTTTLILVAASTQRFPDGDVNYNSGSVDPGAYGTYYIYVDDPLFTGGAVAYLATTSNPTVTANDGRVYFGKITTSAGGGGSGSGGGGGACFTPDTLIRTSSGLKAIAEIREGELVLTRSGFQRVLAVHRHEYEGPLRSMGNQEAVTPTHRIALGWSWVEAQEIFHQVESYKGWVYNLTVEGCHEYTLGNGLVASNVLK